MAELFGRSTGCARGRGGSMHLLDAERGFYGGWGIVAGQLPIATGLALALVRQGRPQAVLCELGDGAVNMGAWHESLNLAALWRLPVVFLVINNEYGMGTSVERASAEPELCERADAFRMHGERVDGDDLEASFEACDRLLRRAREEREPARARGHDLPLPRPLRRRRRASPTGPRRRSPRGSRAIPLVRTRAAPARRRRGRGRARRAGARGRGASPGRGGVRPGIARAAGRAARGRDVRTGQRRAVRAHARRAARSASSRSCSTEGSS